MSKYNGVFSGPHFPAFELNTDCIQSEYRKIRPEKTPYLDAFHAVELSELQISSSSFHSFIVDEWKVLEKAMNIVRNSCSVRAA